MFCSSRIPRTVNVRTLDFGVWCLERWHHRTHPFAADSNLPRLKPHVLRDPWTALTLSLFKDLNASSCSYHATPGSFVRLPRCESDENYNCKGGKGRKLKGITCRQSWMWTSERDPRLASSYAKGVRRWFLSMACDAQCGQFRRVLIDTCWSRSI